MITAAYYGQRTIDNHMNRTFSNSHQEFVAGTIATYSLTALLAVLSPPPSIRRDDEESTTTLHKTLAWIHAAGMIITPIIGSMIGGRRNFNVNTAHFHQVAGYITTRYLRFINRCYILNWRRIMNTRFYILLLLILYFRLTCFCAGKTITSCKKRIICHI